MSITVRKARYDAERIGLSTALIAKLVGVSATSLSNSFRGVGQLSPEKEAELGEKTRRLARYHDALKPFVLPKDELLLNELLVTAVTPEEVREFVARIFPYQM